MTVREVWMWNEWGHAWPLWGVEGPLDAEDLELSEELDAHLQLWHLRWEYLYAYVASRDPEGKTVDAEALAEWEDDGDKLLVRLASELEGRTIVIRAFRFPEDRRRLRLRQRRVRESYRRSRIEPNEGHVVVAFRAPK
ncbi:hypothetical protein ACFRFH_01535 [Leifsonia sp. NPDC056824]|uniref:hypothetical protein n=1 Tax=Leifsonia sp. NPDC056824 TaxID=3345953 RepID=UPI0036BE84E0